MEPAHRALGLTDDEYASIEHELGRGPDPLELAMYAAMWSEHCSYKSSRRFLGRFPTTAPRVLVGPGEGAGVVAVGDGLAVAVRIESHNHPSAVEPYQGAATGVGGIIRDVFSMGARPIALMDSLRFGPLDDARSRYLFEGVVAGISGYGNAVGVPTVGGEVAFDECYHDNPLVNVLCLGVLPEERLVRARAEGVGNLAVLLGASTGRDGIGGASVLASAAFDDAAPSKRPSVQVGDPFEEKKLIEACLALLDAGLVVGVQDLGAAGLSCAASETAANAGAGMDFDVARVARREPGMDPIEVMTSESQERMLAIVRPVDLDAVLRLSARWEVRASVVGRVTDTRRFRVYDGVFDAWGVPGANPDPPESPPPESPPPAPSVSDARPLADVPVESLGYGPRYVRAAAPPADHAERLADDPALELSSRLPSGVDLSAELLGLLGSPTIADKSWIWERYDHQLFLNTVVGPGADATVLRLKGSGRGLALATDGNARYCALEPRTGGRLAVLEAARNVACVGAEPIALVNCLNFGNPEHPAVMWQFGEVVEGISEACEALGIPVVGGNVSFYNESSGADIDPTPVVGVIGLVEGLAGVPAPPALRPGDEVVLLGGSPPELGGSELARRHGLRGGRPPAADLVAGRRLHELVAGFVAEDAVRGVHDCAEGGLAVALAEMAISGSCGFDVELGGAAECFGESASRVVCSVGSGDSGAILARATAAGVPSAVIGTAGGEELRSRGAFAVSVADAGRAWRGALPGRLGAGVLETGATR